MQIQDDFTGAPLSILARAGLHIYRFIPAYQRLCPLCRGENCAVRHGLYRRRVIDHDGTSYERFPIPRFRCRQRGPRRPESLTFSVLPSLLVPRRLPSLSLMRRIMVLFLTKRHSGREVLDQLAYSTPKSSLAWFPETTTLYRILHLFNRAAERLALPPSKDRNRAGARAAGLLRALPNSGSASRLAMTFHRLHFPRLLFSLA